MSSRFDDDVQARQISGPPRYRQVTDGPVAAAEILRDGQTVGYLFHGIDDEEEEVASVVGSDIGDFRPSGSRYWNDRLGEFRSRDVPAADAVRELLGAEGTARAGVVGTEITRYSSIDELRELLDPGYADRRAQRSRRSADTEPLSREQIDAALAGRMPVTEAIAGQVEKIDSALSVHPTAESIVVALTAATSTVGVGLSTGDRVREGGYLLSYLVSTDHVFESVDAIVWLHVPAGVPALPQPPGIPGGPSTLLLGRGIEWEVLRVLDRDGQTVITGRVVDHAPQRVAGHDRLENGLMRMLRDTRADHAYFEEAVDILRRHNESHDERLADPDAVWRKPSYRGSAAGDAMKDETFDRAVAAAEFAWGDQLIDRLIASRRSEHPIGEKLAFSGATKLLNQAFEVDDPAQAAAHVGRYLAKWYPAWKGSHGWGGHDFQDKFHYWGYWAFETVGVVAALGVDDSSFRDDEYYPRDLAERVL